MKLNNKGITLIALVITIIVMLILAGVTINLTIGENGIFTTAKEAKEKQKISEYLERIELARGEVELRNMGEVTLDNLIEQIYEDKIVPYGRISKIDDQKAQLTTDEGYIFIITAENINYAGKGKIETPPDAKEGTIKTSSTIWNKETHKASITIEKESGVAENFEIQYQVNETDDKKWHTGNKVENLNHGDKVYIRLWNGLNGGKSTSIDIKDEKAPTVNINIDSFNTNSIEVTASAEDNEYGMETEPIYTFYLKKESEPEELYKEKQSSKNTKCKFESLEHNTTYNIKVTVKDKAENEGQIEKSINTNAIKYTVTFEGNDATDGNMEAQQFIYGTEQKLNENKFTKTGYVFKGWSKTKGGEKIYNDGQSISIEDNMTLYAVWEQIIITLNTQQAEIIADNTTCQLTATITPQEAKDVELTWSSNDTTVANVDTNGLVTGKSCGRTTITVTNGTYTATATILVDEYLQLKGDLKQARTGGFTLYRNGNNENYDDQNTINGLYCTVHEASYTAAYISNNAIDLSKIGKLIFNASAYTNSPKLSLYYKVGVTNIKNATDNKEDWIIADGIKRTFSEEYIAETLEIPVDVWNVNSGYLKIFLHHGTETQNMSCFMTNNYILAKPK